MFEMADGVSVGEVRHLIGCYLNEAKEHPGTILTESDLKCGLYRKLSEHPTLRTPLATKSGPQYTANWIHTEIPWFDSERRLSYRPDITILDPRYLNLLSEPGYNLPSKQFSFDGRAILLELKFARWPTGLDNQTVEEVRKDFLKISALLQRLRDEQMDDDVFCIFVVVSRFYGIADSWSALEAEITKAPRCALIYFTLGFPVALPGQETT